MKKEELLVSTALSDPVANVDMRTMGKSPEELPVAPEAEEVACRYQEILMCFRESWTTARKIFLVEAI